MKPTFLKFTNGDSSFYVNPQHVSAFSVADDGSTTTIHLVSGQEMEADGDQYPLLTGEEPAPASGEGLDSLKDHLDQHSAGSEAAQR